MKERNIPASRKNLSSALSLLGVKSTGELSEKSFFMSLSDQYWIAPTSTKLDLNKIISQIIFQKMSEKHFLKN